MQFKLAHRGGTGWYPPYTYACVSSSLVHLLPSTLSNPPSPFHEIFSYLHRSGLLGPYQQVWVMSLILGTNEETNEGTIGMKKSAFCDLI